MNKAISQSQIQMYRQQNIARQQQVKMVNARTTKTSTANIIPIQTSQTSATVNVRPKNTLNTRNITESDVTNFIKRQQLLQQKQAQAQAITVQSSISSAGSSIVKTSVQSLMLSTNAKNTISVTGATKNINSQQQQFRHLTLQQPMLAHRKIPAQKVTQLSQVVVNC